MISLEQVEKLRDYAKVSYEDAKLALEVSNGDMLEAVIYLEKIGKISSPENGGQYSTNNTSSENASHENNGQEKTKNGDNYEYTYNYSGDDFKKQSRKFVDVIKDWCKKGSENYFEARRYGKVMISVPVIVLVLALAFFFWITLPLMVVGLFFGCSYHFKGPDLKNENNPLNQAMDAAKGAAEQVKTVFEDEKK